MYAAKDDRSRVEEDDDVFEDACEQAFFNPGDEHYEGNPPDCVGMIGAP